MAGKTIKTLTYRVDLDTAGFNNSIKATRKEMTAARKVLRETITPSQKFENEISKLDHLYKKGLISQRAYTRGLKRQQDQLRRSTKTASAFSKVFSTTNLIRGGLAGIAGGAVVSGMRRFSSEMAHQIELMAELSKQAKLLDTSVEFLSGLSAVAGATSGLNQQEVVNALSKMTIRVARARSDPNSEFGKTFRALRLDVEKLSKLNPAQVFREVSEAFREIDNQQDALNLAEKLFEDGGARILTTMQLQSKEFEKQLSLAKEMGKVVTTQQAQKALEADAKIKDLEARLQGFKRQVAIDVVDTLDERGGRGLAALSILGDPTFWAHPVDSIKRGITVASQGGPVNLKLNRDFRTLAEQRLLRDEAEKTEADVKADALGSSRARLLNAGLARLVNVVSAGDFGGAFTGAFNAPSRRKRVTTQTVDTFSDPAESIVAGSSEAFKIFNRTKTTQTVEVELQKKSVSLQEKTANAVTGLFEMARSEISEFVDL